MNLVSWTSYWSAQCFFISFLQGPFWVQIFPNASQSLHHFSSYPRAQKPLLCLFLVSTLNNPFAYGHSCHNGSTLCPPMTSCHETCYDFDFSVSFPSSPLFFCLPRTTKALPLPFSVFFWFTSSVSRLPSTFALVSPSGITELLNAVRKVSQLSGRVISRNIAFSVSGKIISYAVN